MISLEDSSRLDEKILSTVIYKVSKPLSYRILDSTTSVISDVNAYSNVYRIPLIVVPDFCILLIGL
jgi:hypothetical protein